MTTNCLGETLAAQITTGNEITHVAAHRSVVLFRHANRHAERLDTGPRVLQWKIDLPPIYVPLAMRVGTCFLSSFPARWGRWSVAEPVPTGVALILAAMALLGRLMFPVRHLQKVALTLIAEQLLNRVV